MNDEEKSYLEFYLEELDSIKPYTEEEKKELLAKAMNGDKQAKNDYINANLIRVTEIARLYVNQGVLLEDLIGEGNVALASSMDIVEEEEDVNEAEEMVVSMIMKAMEELVADDANSKDAFEEWAERANEVLDKARELSEDYLRKITIRELCEEAGYTEEFVRDVMDVTGGGIEFIDMTGEKNE
jgi:RNA polymerase primary sigma factor